MRIKITPLKPIYFYLEQLLILGDIIYE